MHRLLLYWRGSTWGGGGGREAPFRGEAKQAGAGKEGKEPEGQRGDAGGAVDAPRGREVGFANLVPGVAQRPLGHGGPLCNRLLNEQSEGLRARVPERCNWA